MDFAVTDRLTLAGSGNRCLSEQLFSDDRPCVIDLELRGDRVARNRSTCECQGVVCQVARHAALNKAGLLVLLFNDQFELPKHPSRMQTDLYPYSCLLPYLTSSCCLTDRVSNCFRIARQRLLLHVCDHARKCSVDADGQYCHDHRGQPCGFRM